MEGLVKCPSKKECASDGMCKHSQPHKPISACDTLLVMSDGHCPLCIPYNGLVGIDMCYSKVILIDNSSGKYNGGSVVTT